MDKVCVCKRIRPFFEPVISCLECAILLFCLVSLRLFSVPCPVHSRISHLVDNSFMVHRWLAFWFLHNLTGFSIIAAFELHWINKSIYNHAVDIYTYVYKYVYSNRVSYLFPVFPISMCVFCEVSDEAPWLVRWTIRCLG